MTRSASIFDDGFLFLRHGQSAANLDGLIAGASDVPLTDKGRREAEMASRLLAGAGVNRIVTSRLSRAIETARIVADGLGLEVETVEEIGERSWGVLEGRLLCERPDYFATVEGGESWDEFRARTDAALDALAGNGVLLVGHAGTWRVISARLGLPVDADAVRNATPIRVMPRGRRPAWLPLAG